MQHDLTFEGHGVRLVPLAPEHAPALLRLVDEAMWAGMSSATPRTADDMLGEVARGLETPGRLAFAVLDAATGEMRGSTSFYDWFPAVPRVEIGHTYYGRAWWGGTTNPACKLLLLTHAFEVWGCRRVALRADVRNVRSTDAIRRLGAKPEGVLRAHRRGGDGVLTDTAYFSVLAPEWPAVRAGLVERLAAAAAEPRARDDEPGAGR